METPVAEPSALPSQLAQPVAEAGVVGTPTVVADRLPIRTDQVNRTVS